VGEIRGEGKCVPGRGECGAGGSLREGNSVTGNDVTGNGVTGNGVTGNDVEGKCPRRGVYGKGML